MNKNSKRIISLILSIVLTLSCFSIISFAAESEEVYPTIYIKGQGSNLTVDGTINGESIYPVELPDGYLTDKAKELVNPLTKALLTGDWKDYNDCIYNAAIPYVGRYACDENGNVTDGSGSKWSPGTTPIPIQTGSSLKAFFFDYDWRLDPVECAETLYKYIEYVKAKTGSEKVNILARCLGVNIVLAYADEYGTADINKCLICCSGFDGFETIGALFSGEIEFDSAALKRFSDCYLSTENYAGDATFDLLRNFIGALQGTPLLGYTSDTMNRIFKNIKDDAWKRIIRDSYGTFPSFWSLIGDEYYEKAKTFLFGGEEEKYAGLIEKIDNFHYNVLNNYEEILDNAEADGTKFYNVVKYGLQFIPVTGADMTMSDTMVSTNTSAIGATCSNVNATLSSKYLASADAKYISPDKQIDASTCKYPDHTWFIKNMSHRNMPNSIDSLFEAILTAPGYATVDDVEGYPQFNMTAEDGKEIIPATADNTNTTVDKMNEKPFVSFFKLIANLISRFFEKLFNR